MKFIIFVTKVCYLCNFFYFIKIEREVSF